MTVARRWLLIEWMFVFAGIAGAGALAASGHADPAIWVVAQATGIGIGFGLARVLSAGQNPT